MDKVKKTILFLILGLFLILIAAGGAVFFEKSRLEAKLGNSLKEKLKKINNNEEVELIVLLKKKPENFENFARKGIKVEKVYDNIPGFSIKLSKNQIKELAKLEITGKIGLNKPVKAYFKNSLPLIGIDKIWQKGINGSGVKVCIPDTGIDFTHPALKGKIINQKDFVNNDRLAIDDRGHGTHVAGIIASGDLNYKGIAPGVSLLSAKVLDNKGKGDYQNMIKGIDWCVSKGADIINISLGGGGFKKNCNDDILASAANYIVGAYDIVIVAGAGNAGKKGMGSPACASGVIAVGAVDNKGYVPLWSSEGEEMDILAPGSKIVSLAPRNKYARKSGTSMAAPHISGIAALMLEAEPKASVSNIKEVLYSTAVPPKGCYECDIKWREKCVPIRSACAPNNVGAGIVNIEKALSALKSFDPSRLGERKPFDQNTAWLGAPIIPGLNWPVSPLKDWFSFFGKKGKSENKKTELPKEPKKENNKNNDGKFNISSNGASENPPLSTESGLKSTCAQCLSLSQKYKLTIKGLKERSAAVGAVSCRYSCSEFNKEYVLNYKGQTSCGGQDYNYWESESFSSGDCPKGKFYLRISLSDSLNSSLCSSAITYNAVDDPCWFSDPIFEALWQGDLKAKTCSNSKIGSLGGLDLCGTNSEYKVSLEPL